MTQVDHDEYDEFDDDVDDYEPPEKLEIKVEIEKLTFTISKKVGREITHLITDCYKEGIPNYCKKVGIQHPNFYSTIRGSRPCTLEFLNKLLSGIGYQATLLNPVIVIQELVTGQVVPDVDYVSPVIESQSFESINLLEQTIQISSSSSLERPQENLRTKPDNHSLESLVEFSNSILDSQESTSPTSLPTQLDVDQ